MLFSFATANLYFKPFEQVLDIIAGSGFENIELDLFWERKDWAMAQHLRDMPIRRVVQLIRRSGLKITSIHDGGGVLHDGDSAAGYINPLLSQYLDEIGYAPECLVFHTPHLEGDQDNAWWKNFSGRIVEALEPYRKMCSYITIENVPFFAGYYVPMTDPVELCAFASQNGFGITFDTTHCAEIGVDIVDAARKINHTIQTIHLSDYVAGQRHVFIGEGELDLPGFFNALDKESVNAVTLECSLSTFTKSAQDMIYTEMVARLRAARLKLVELLI